MNYQSSFIHHIIDSDLRSGKYIHVCTRFPPEPNGYLHIGHAKSIYINFNIANYYHGKCNLRFDDTNPEKEQKDYIEAIKYDIKWLGFSWYNQVHYASDYFEIFFNYAIILIKKGLAYVDELSIDDIKIYRGTLVKPGKNSPYRSRSIEDNLIYFYKMKKGMFKEGGACLRAKIDMSASCIIMRDPVLYRIKYTPHPRLGTDWCIYPTYDFSHCISDAIEGITHSLCTLEFQDNRILYNWILCNIGIKIQPNQYEFSRLNIKYISTSKRKLDILIKKKIVSGWDDPRIPTIAGLRRRGYTAESIHTFCNRIGISKQDSQIELSSLESCIRDDLNQRALRLMAVIYPIKIIINNLPQGYKETIIMPNHPNNATLGTRDVIFSKEIFIDYFDFCEKLDHEKYSKLILGKKIRLRYAYVIKAEYIERDINGNLSCIYCSYDPNTLHNNPVGNKKIKGVIHWVSAMNNIPSEFHLYDKLFTHPNPVIKDNIINDINPNSLVIARGFVEEGIKNFYNFGPYQFEREGYFVIDNNFQKNKKIYPYLVFNRTVSLKKSKELKKRRSFKN